ncbi:hypothetical protein N9737_03315 [Polaribacter sp.]|nr:hypothetical protein [Polaribacter sp.]
MIHIIERKDLDVDKYDACIADSVQSRIYAFSWYLDVVTDNWDILILNDYEAVMPLPWKQKYFLKYITQPFFCQQLGVFSKEPITVKFQEKMIHSIPKKFVKTTINFNSDNFFTFKMKSKNNYLLKIENVYAENYKKFNNNRKRDLKKAISSGLYFEENISIKEFYDFYLLNDKNYLNHLSMQEVLQNILKLNTSVVHCYGIKSKTDLIASVILLNDGKRITYLVPVCSALGKKKGAATLLVAEIIKKYKDKILDFEGAMIPGVAKFYKSFGAEIERYNVFSQSII